MKYVNVLSDTKALNTMLAYSEGVREIPVTVDQGRVTIGFKGQT